MKHEGLSGETCLFVEVTAGVTGRRRSRWRPGRGRSAEAGACAVRLACRSQSFALSNARSWVHPGSNPTTVCHCYKFCLEGDQAINISICFKKSIREILWKTLTKPGAWVSHRGMRKLIGRRDTEPRRSQMIKKRKGLYYWGGRWMLPVNVIGIRRWEKVSGGKPLGCYLTWVLTLGRIPLRGEVGDRLCGGREQHVAELRRQKSFPPDAQQQQLIWTCPR